MESFMSSHWNEDKKSLDRIKLGAFGKKKEECDHEDTPAMVRKERRTHRNPRLTRQMRFVSLHHHSTYSFLDGFQLPEAHVRRITELNGSALALTEHGNVMSHVKFEQAAKRGGIKPIFGIELYTGEIDPERRQQLKNHLTILARNQDGYRNILQLVSRSYMEGFYYEATVSGKMLAEHRAGLVVLSGCTGSLLYTSLMGGKGIEPDAASYRRALGVAQRFRRTFGDDYYIEVQAFPELEGTRKANPQLARIASELKIPLVATLDCHYTLPTDSELQKVLHALRSGGKSTPEDLAKSWGYAAELCPPANDRDLLRRLVATGLTRQEAINAILMTEEIAQDCTVELPRLPMVSYPGNAKDMRPWGIKAPDEDSRPASSLEVWEHWLKEGWKFRGCDDLPLSERRKYAQRLRHERSIIEEKAFSDYFLIVSDAVRFAKDSDIGVGPARGSAAASLVCWLLRITEVNPMAFPHLVFERFIDITRFDLPDIDLDFESTRRGEVVDYLVSKYGREQVSQIGTFQTFKSKLALDDVARVHRIPQYEVEQIKDVLLERSSGDLRASATILDTIEQFEQAAGVVERYPNILDATELEGNVKGFGTHAAGVAISNDPITEVTAILEREVNKRTIQVVAIDKYDAEYLGVLKIDLLGVSALDALIQMCRQLDKPASFLYEIPIEDEPTIQGFKENDVVGIFQFEGRACRMVCGAVRPDDFNEVCHITALARPGPLHNGAVADYVDIKRGEKQPHLRHPALEGITGFTQFQIVYQEQILQIVREIGNFDWTHAAYIRKIISRKLGDAEFNKQWERFWDGASTLHERTDFPQIDKELARSIWGDLTTSGSYAFNAAHSVSYGYIAWWTMWWKQHHPEIFYAAMLDRADGRGGGSGANAKASAISKAQIDPHTIMLRDAIGHGFTILPYDIQMSGMTWQAETSYELRPGFDQIDGVGPAMAQKIIEWRDEKAKTFRMQRLDWPSLIEVKGIGPKTIDKLVAHATAEDPFGVKTMDRMIASCKKGIRRGMKDSDGNRLPRPTHKAIEVPYERGEDLGVVWIGIPVHRNLRDIFEVNRARTGEELDPATVRNPELNEWMLIAGYDGTDLLSLRVSRWKYQTFKKLLWKIKLHEDVLLVRGVKPGWRSAREIYVTDMWVMAP
jgi:DNA polymerase-3 subunit alpha